MGEASETVSEFPGRLESCYEFIKIAGCCEQPLGISRCCDGVNLANVARFLAISIS
jgi:hypothetical protein